MAGEVEERGRRADLVAEEHDGALALGVDKHRGVGVSVLKGFYAFGGEALVDVASAVPQDHRAARDRIDVGSEVAVGAEYDFLVGGE